MRIQSAHLQNFRRFTDLTIGDLPQSARLVVLTGPNGSGKSSLFDGFKKWQQYRQHSTSGDLLYYHKQGSPKPDSVDVKSPSVTFYDPIPTDREKVAQIFYVRSAYRNQPDFSSDSIRKIQTPFTNNPFARMIDNDAIVSENYERLVADTLRRVYSAESDLLTVPQLREQLIGEVQAAMATIFDDLILEGIGDPLAEGSFFFTKGNAKHFHYKNLSGGEKAAFDLLLDFIVKRLAYDNTVFCLDEPEAHMHTRLQAKLLHGLFGLLPDACQLWIATHAIGMLRTAKELSETSPDNVVFLSFYGHDFDKPTTIRPAQLDRSFWSDTLTIALDDLANLVAPKQIVLCEGRPASADNDWRAEFDARCYRAIFASEYPDTDFASVGNVSDVKQDRLYLGRTIQTLVSGTQVLRLIDRDDCNPSEIEELKMDGMRVLSRRHLEAYLLDDEVLTAFCSILNQNGQVPALVAAKQTALEASVARGNAPDDLKSAAGDIYQQIKRILQLKGYGNTVQAFMRDSLAPLVKPPMAVYAELRRDIFGS